ncbi:hypothetical protein BH23VER1_BH23VER1_32060 [soil metagenome]
MSQLGAISDPPDSDAHLLSAWTAGIAMLFLGIGLSGAIVPLAPELPEVAPDRDLPDEIMVEVFDPPPAGAADEAPADDAEPEMPAEDLEIPPPPEVTAPLTPPEMVELTPLEPLVEKKPAPRPMARPVAPTEPPARKPSSRTGTQTGTRTGSRDGAGATGTPGGTGAPTVFRGTGRGRFPAPSYPTSARRAGHQGTVQLLVTVEPSGVPSSVSVTSSSGHSALDTAARDQVQRRWRWPAGEIRRFIIPVQFVMQ